jgi:hypothetical protein
MSRTTRTKPTSKCALRHPQTYNEIKGLNRIKTDDALDIDYPISSRNRRPPTSWDDQVASSWYQLDYKR